MPALMKRNVLGGALFLDTFGIKGAMISFQSCAVMMMVCWITAMLENNVDDDVVFFSCSVISCTPSPNINERGVKITTSFYFEKL